MKPIFALLTLFVPFLSLAQETMEGKMDTILTQDKNNPDLYHSIIFYPNKEIKAQGSYLNNKKEGVWRSYYDGGILETLAEYHEGRKTGISIQLNFNGQIQLEENYKNDILDGKRKLYHESNQGKLMYSEEYKNGKLNGTKIYYYENGLKMEESQWKEGKKDGLSKWYYQNGNVSIEYTYTMDIFSGPSKTYYGNGNVKAEGNYVNDMEQGEWKEYSEDEQLVKIVTYDKGKVIKEKSVKPKKK